MRLAMKKQQNLTVLRQSQPPFSAASRRLSSNGKASPFAAALGPRLSELGFVVCREVEANFRAWFERNFINRRAGRVGNVSYSRAGALDDRPGDGAWYADAHARAWADYNDPPDPSELAYVFSHPLVAFQLSVGITDLRGLRCMRRGLTLYMNRLQQKSYRSRYYGRDNARRRMLAAERRKITKRTTTNPCPTPEEFRAAFARVKDSVEAKLFFGGMVHDLACYVDSCLRYDGSGNIVGRNGGIKEWLADNVPELYPRYKTVMRYKALAMRLRQAVGLKDPEPTSALLADPDDTQYGETPSKGGRRTDPRGGGKAQVEPPRAAGRKGTVTGERDESASWRKKETVGGRNEEAWGDENYYAQDSHNGKGGCRGNADGGEGKTDGACGMGLERMRQGKEHVPRRGETMPQQGETMPQQYGMARKRGEMARKRGEMARKRGEMARRLLAGCENTFKGVFGMVDAALGASGRVDA